MPGSLTCPGGGVVAIGVAWARQSISTYRGVRYHEIVEGDVVTNDGSECFFRNNPAGAAEVFAHELGHTLGLGHSADPEALMWATAHDDGRGALLGEDDREAVSALYGDGTYRRPAAPSPTPPPPTAHPPAAPTGLTAAARSPTAVALAWKGRAAGDDFRVELKMGKRFVELLAMPAGSAEAVVGGLAPAHAYVFRLRAHNAQGYSPYTPVVRVTTPRSKPR
jgi:hypothetical protein